MKSVPSYVTNWRKIVSITPYYRENGANGCVIRYIDGREERYHCRCDFVVKKLATAFRTTMEISRKRSAAATGRGCSRKPPLALHQDFCLIQLKCREEEWHNSGTLGYVVLQYIKEVQELDHGCGIVFHRKVAPLTVLQRKSSVEQNIARAWLVQAMFDVEQMQWQTDASTVACQMENDLDD